MGDDSNNHDAALMQGAVMEHRAKNSEDRLEMLEAATRRLSGMFVELSGKIDKNNEMTEGIKSILDSLAGFVRVVVWVGRGLRFVGFYFVLPVAFVIACIYALFHGGQMPPFWAGLLKEFL